MGILVSVIVPVYNVELYIEKCIESIISQTYGELDIILIDDGSQDTSGEICDKYSELDERIRVIHKRNEGLSAARNLGIEISKGQYLCFVDSDDYVEADFISCMLNACVHYGKDIAICGRILEYSTYSVKEYVSNQTEVFGNNEALSHLFKTDIYNMAAWDKMYAKKLFKDVRYPYGKIHEDIYTTALLMEKSNGIVKIPNQLYHYIQRETGITGELYGDSSFDMVSNSLECYEHFYKNENLRNELFRYYFLHIYTCYMKLIKSKKKRKYLEQYKKLRRMILHNSLRGIINPYINLKMKINIIGILLFIR